MAAALGSAAALSAAASASWAAEVAAVPPLAAAMGELTAQIKGLPSLQQVQYLEHAAAKNLSARLMLSAAADPTLLRAQRATIEAALGPAQTRELQRWSSWIMGQGHHEDSPQVWRRIAPNGVVSAGDLARLFDGSGVPTTGLVDEPPLRSEMMLLVKRLAASPARGGFFRSTGAYDFLEGQVATSASARLLAGAILEGGDLAQREPKEHIEALLGPDAAREFWGWAAKLRNASSNGWVKLEKELAARVPPARQPPRWSVIRLIDPSADPGDRGSGETSRISADPPKPAAAAARPAGTPATAELVPALSWPVSRRDGDKRVRTLGFRDEDVLINGKTARAFAPAREEHGVVIETLVHPEDPKLLVDLFHDRDSLAGHESKQDALELLTRLSAAGAAPRVIEHGETAATGRGLVFFLTRELAEGVTLGALPPEARGRAAEDLFAALEDAGLSLVVPGADEAWLLEHLLLSQSGEGSVRAYLLDARTTTDEAARLPERYAALRSVLEPAAAGASLKVVAVAAPPLGLSLAAAPGASVSRIVAESGLRDRAELLSEDGRFAVLRFEDQESFLEAAKALAASPEVERVGLAAEAKAALDRGGAQPTLPAAPSRAAASAAPASAGSDAAQPTLPAAADSAVELARQTLLDKLKPDDGVSDSDRMHIGLHAASVAAIGWVRHVAPLSEPQLIGPTGKENGVAITATLTPAWPPRRLVELLRGPSIRELRLSASLRADVEREIGELGPDQLVPPAVEPPAEAPPTTWDLERHLGLVESYPLLAKLSPPGRVVHDDLGREIESQADLEHVFIVPAEGKTRADVQGLPELKQAQIVAAGTGLRGSGGLMARVSGRWGGAALAALLRRPEVAQLHVSEALRREVERVFLKPGPKTEARPGIEKLHALGQRDPGDRTKIFAYEHRGAWYPTLTRWGLQEEWYSGRRLSQPPDVRSAARLTAVLIADPDMEKVIVSPEVARAVKGELIRAFDPARVGAAASFVRVEPGKTWMGENEYPYGHSKEVRFTRSYEIQATPVTQLQYYLVTGRLPSANSKKRGFRRDPNFRKVPEGTLNAMDPVTNVSWDDAQGFIKLLNESQSDYTYRLPTEAEWHRASRAEGFPSAYDWRMEGYRPQGKGTRPVGLTTPNGWGLHDILGHVREWVEDDYDELEQVYWSAVDPVVRYFSHVPNRMHVVRGGSWLDGSDIARRRLHMPEDARAEDLGLRLVRERRADSPWPPPQAP